VPAWSKELTLKFPTFNARSETAAEKPTFKSAVKSKRALVPATGYYEWRTEGKVKTPYFIGPASGLLAFAGLYSWWKNPAVAEDDPAKWVLTATIMTMPTVPSLAPIHDRNPMPLPRDFWDDWLSPALDGDQAFVDAAVAASVPVAEALSYHEVAPVRGDGPELIAPLS
jgi:putative SOS response-associated peptidase YedK